MARAAVVEIPITPGADSDDTDLAAKLRAVDMDKVRYRGLKAETIHGWSQFSASGMSSGLARGVHAWSDLLGNKWLIAASPAAVNVWNASGTRTDITPRWIDVFLDATGLVGGITWKPYTVATGTSAVAPHNLQVNDVITITGSTTAGTYTVTAVPSPTTLTVTPAFGAAVIDPPAVVATVPFRAGLTTGTGDLVSQQTRIWSISNFGEAAVFCASDGTPIWMWSPASSYPELVTNGTFAASTNWTTAAGWAISLGVATFTGPGGAYGPINMTQDMSTAGLTAGKIYELSFTITANSVASVTLDIKLGNVKIYPSMNVNGAGYNRTYTCRFVCPANPTTLAFSASGTGSGTLSIDNVSIKLYSLGVPISQAPQINRALFVDGNHILTSLATVQADGTFNPMLMRWCAQDDLFSWVPDTDNVAGELSLGVGSKAICGLPVGGHNLVFSDDAVYASQFTTNGYSLTLVGQGPGPVGPRAATSVNNIAFWASLKGIFMFDGARVLPIEMPIKDRYVAQLAQYQENKTFLWVSTEFGEVWIHYPHTSDGTEVSRYLLYDYQSNPNTWAFGTFNRTAWIRSGIFSFPIAFDTSGAVLNQETGNAMSGSTLPYMETGWATGGSGDRWIGCRRYYPDVENQTGNMLITIKGKRAPQGLNNTSQIGPLVCPPNQNKLDFLIRSRQLKMRFASQASPTFWRLGVVGLEMLSDRERR